MKHILLIGLVALTKAAPQYSGQTQDLSGTQLDTIKDIFGAEAGDGYSEQQSGKLNEGTNGVEVMCLGSISILTALNSYMRKVKGG